MRRALVSSAVVLLVGVGLFVGVRYYHLRSAALDWEEPVPDILTEKLEKQADTLRVTFTSRIDAPLPAIWDAFSQPERSAEFSDTVRVARLLRAEENRKLVLFEMTLLGQPQRLSLEFTFVPGEHLARIRSVESQLSDIRAEYRFTSSPDGRKTLLTYTGTIRDKARLPVPLALQKSAARESFVSTVRALKRSLAQSGSVGAGPSISVPEITAP